MTIPYNTALFPHASLGDMKYKVLNWVNRFSIFCFLDNNRYPSSDSSIEVLVAAGALETISGKAGDRLTAFQERLNKEKSWWFGHLGYDLKNETETGLLSNLPDEIGFDDLLFFRPRHIIRLHELQVEIMTIDDPASVWKDITESDEETPTRSGRIPPIQSRLTREEYIRQIDQLRAHILRGDCYEINFCQEFFARQVPLQPLSVYRSLSELSPNPFSAYYRNEAKYLICASPERYLRKKGTHLLSQPIKGTSPRYPGDADLDCTSRNTLMQSAKDRSENVMVVDLVRNDLSRICKESTVKVDELYGIYTFPQVHQMISTISGELDPSTDFASIIRATFPMGSMTGAPKRKVMELIEQYERTKRGLFSGAVGYITPDGDFDFNVVIRSLFYNDTTGYLSYSVGSGITFYSDPEKEYEECLIKAEAIRRVLAE